MNGVPIPDFVLNAPELLPGLEFYVKAFFDLDSERPASMGIASIPTSKIREYGVWHSLTKLEIADLCEIIREVDRAHVKRVSAKIAQDSKRSSQ